MGSGRRGKPGGRVRQGQLQGRSIIQVRNDGTISCSGPAARHILYVALFCYLGTWFFFNILKFIPSPFPTGL